MTIAYVFWHTPDVRDDAASYERLLTGFQDALRREPPEGFARSWTVAVPALPWLPDGGYEDWYVVRDFHALGALNDAAVDARHRRAHDAVAPMAGFGVAGVFRLVAGDPRPFPNEAWVSKPHGTPYAEFLPRITPTGRGALWQRQMALGPTPEFCVAGARPRTDLGAVSVAGRLLGSST